MKEIPKGERSKRFGEQNCKENGHYQLLTGCRKATKAGRFDLPEIHLVFNFSAVMKIFHHEIRCSKLNKTLHCQYL